MTKTKMTKNRVKQKMKKKSKGSPPRAKARAPARAEQRKRTATRKSRKLAAREKTKAQKGRVLAKKTEARSKSASVVLPAATEPVSVAEQDALRAKFELGPPEWTKVLDAREKAQTIPWGYGRDKVVAMAVDPERLFVYWEVTDEAIARARAGLGPAGDDCWLDLRVYDVTDVLFDGSNAHHHFDVGIARADRQWFVVVNRPTSTVIVELGLVARGGGFATIARSHRVDFPRREPAPAASDGGPDAVEWLTVREVAGGAGTRGGTAGRPRAARVATAPYRVEIRDASAERRLLARWELASSRPTLTSAPGTGRGDAARPDAGSNDDAAAPADHGAGRTRAGSEERLRAARGQRGQRLGGASEERPTSPTSPSANRGSR